MAILGIAACRTAATSPVDAGVDAAIVDAAAPIDAGVDAALDVVDADVAEAAVDAGPPAKLTVTHSPGFCGAGSPDCHDVVRSLTSDGVLRGLGKPRTVDAADTASLFQLARDAFDTKPRCIPLRPDSASTEIVLVEGTKQRSVTMGRSSCGPKLDEVDRRVFALKGTTP